MHLRMFTQIKWQVLAFALVLTLTTTSFAQKPDRAPETSAVTVQVQPPTGNVEKALWDLQFSYDVSTDPGEQSMSNGYFVNNELLIAEWNSSVIARFDADGNFIENTMIMDGATPLSGTRSMTFDGTSLWVTNNTMELFQVDAATLTVTSSIFVTVADPIRWITYDANGNGGAGSLWGGNFSTALYEFALDGSLLTTIPAATHGLGGMYGAAIDNNSPGGPYLWVFSQAGEPIDAVIYQLQMPGGTQTGVARNVEPDLGTSGALAGGLFITDEYDTVNGTMTIGGVIQNEPDIAFGYELTFEPGPNLNPGVANVTSPVTACGLSDAEPIIVDITNDGTEEVSNIPVTLIVNDEEIVTETVPGPIAPGGTLTYTFNQTLDMSNPGLYFIDIEMAFDGDVSNVNNLTDGFAASKNFDPAPNILQTFEEYEVFAFIFNGLYNEGDIGWFANEGETGSADTGPATDASGSGKYIYMEASGFAAGDQAVLGTDCLDLTNAESLSLAFFYHMYGAGIGSLSVDIVDENGTSNNVFLQEGQVQTSSAEEWEPALLVLDEYVGGVVEMFFTGTIGTMPEAFQCDIAMDDISITAVLSDVGEISTLNKLQVHPNPATDQFNVVLDLNSIGQNVELYLFDNLGRQLDFVQARNFQNGTFEMNTADFSPGMYNLKIVVDGEVVTKKVVLQR